MVAFNFMECWVPKIVKGEKCQTIRREARCKPGDTLQLYTGLRTKKARKIIPDVVCIDTDYCAIRKDCITFGNADKHPSADEFARADGFRDYKEMYEWFCQKYETVSFIGKVIKWQSTKGS